MTVEANAATVAEEKLEVGNITQVVEAQAIAVEENAAIVAEDKMQVSTDAAAVAADKMTV